MKITIKNLKTIRGEEGYAFNCTLYVDGVKAALVTNGGYGGCSEYNWSVGPDKSFYGGDFSKKVYAYVASLPPVETTMGGEPFSYKRELDGLIEDAINEQEVIKQYKRWCKKDQQTVWRTPDMKEGDWKVVSRAFTAEYAAEIRAKHPGAVFANELVHAAS